MLACGRYEYLDVTAVPVVATTTPAGQTRPRTQQAPAEAPLAQAPLEGLQANTAYESATLTGTAAHRHTTFLCIWFYF